VRGDPATTDGALNGGAPGSGLPPLAPFAWNGAVGLARDIADAVTPNPRFSLVPSATVDEGNNWINVSWGPLSMTNPSVLGTDGNHGGEPPLGNYSLQTSSPAVSYIGCATGSSLTTGCHVPAVSGISPALILPTTDFYGNPRPDGSATSGRCPSGSPCYHADVGAVELQVGR